MKLSDAINAIGLTPTANLLGMSKQAAHKRGDNDLTTHQAALVLQATARVALVAAERLCAAAASLQQHPEQ
jgi:hypothetical protein